MSHVQAAQNSELIDELNVLLRGELAAVESYDRTVELFEPYPAAVGELRRIRNEHLESIKALRALIGAEGGKPSESSGPWGRFASVITTAAKLIGTDTTLADLQRGEELGVAEYREALTRPLSRESEELISRSLLPRCESHVATLERVREFLR